MNNKYKVLDIPEKPEYMSYEKFFSIYFPLTPRIESMDISKQLKLLFTAQQLCSKSNRNTGQYNFREHFLRRDGNGICCHPIFVSAKENSKILDDEDEKPLAEICSDGLINMRCLVHPLPDINDIGRDYFGPLPFLAEIMIRSGMIIGPYEKLQRHPTYPEEFRHGDILKLAVPWSDDPDECRYFRNDGTYVWMVTEDYPHGHPYSLSYRPYDYGCLPPLIHFSETVAPNAYVNYIRHNTIVYPEPGLMKRILKEIKFIPVAKFRADRETDPVPDHNCMKYYYYDSQGRKQEDSNDYNVPYAELEIENGGMGNNVYVILFNMVQILSSKYPNEVVLNHIETRMNTVDYACYLGKTRIGLGLKYYIGFMCLNKDVLDKEFVRWTETSTHVQKLTETDDCQFELEN